MNVVLDPRKDARSRLRMVDCDIHPTFRKGFADLHPYLAARWLPLLTQYGPLMRGAMSKTAAHPKMVAAIARADAWPPNGAPAGSDLPFMQEQHLDPNDVEFGMLQPLTPLNIARNYEFGAALCSALNDWQVESWTRHDQRLRGGIVIEQEDPESAVAEIHARAADKSFAQVVFPPRSALPPGSKMYDPIWRAAVEHNLPIGMHISGSNGHAQSGAGHPTYYWEDHHYIVQIMQSCVMSFIFEGVFERFPTLRIVMIEGGFGWVPSLAWRMDKHWARMRDEVPHVKRPPSEYLREHFWFTTQPIEETDRPGDLINLVDQIGWDRLLFSTDYPHWDMDDPKYAFRAPLTEAQRAAVFRDNAKALYGF